jgi:DNA helicase-2/ATP-dependent DNA helicase PcrA
LILLRSDYLGMFSRPIRRELDRRKVPVSDPDEVKHMMAEEANRYFLEVIRLLVSRTDSLAWAGLIELTAGIGRAFVDHVYGRARDGNIGFGNALLAAHKDGFADAPAASRGKAVALLDRVIPWLEAHRPPDEMPEEGWGRWATDLADGDVLPEPTPEFRDLLLELDTIAEADQALGRFMAQVQPLGEDLASARSGGVRIMGMSRAKGLTVHATIVAAVEDNVIPRPEADGAEERRLLYVAMTRARSYLFVTWARRRRGPTARSGTKQVWELRRHSRFPDSGPVESTDGPNFLRERWPRERA